MRLDRLTILLMLTLLGSATPTPAQGVTSAPAIRGAIIGASGVSAASGTSGGALSVTTTIGMTDRFAIEGSGVFSMAHSGTGSQSVTGSLLINLLPAKETERIVPYVAGGVGLYRATFDMDEMGFGSVMAQNAGYTSMMSLPGGGFGMMQGGNSYVAGNPVFVPANMPRFYADRMGVLTPTKGRFGTRSFADPAVSFGGGVQIRAGRHLVVRPDARVSFALANGDQRAVGVVTVGLGYGF